MSETKQPEVALEIDTSEQKSVNFVEKATELVAKLKNYKEIQSVSDVVALVAPLMRLVASLKNMDGADKKNLVLTALRMLIANAKLPEDAKVPITFAVDSIVPPMIDEFFNIKPEDFKKQLSKFKGLFCCCSSTS
jgi:hypothetical protein